MKTTQTTPSVSYSFTMRLTYPNEIGMFARIVNTIGKHGGDIGAVDIVAPDAKSMTRDITVRARDGAHQEQIVSPVAASGEVKVVNVSDRVFLLHLGGKIAIQNKVPLTTRDTLSMAYTPGVARVCEAIAAEPRKAWQLTIKGNSVAVVSDGTAVLGLGDIGPEAAMPVMEGKAMLFKEFAGIDAYPICLRTKDTAGNHRDRQSTCRWASAASTWKTSPRRAVSRSSASSRSNWTSRSFTTTSTARRSWCWRRCSTPCG